MLVVSGAADMLSASLRNAILQQSATPDMQGRTQGVYIMIAVGGPRIADLLHGWSAEPLGGRRNHPYRRNPSHPGCEGVHAALPAILALQKAQLNRSVYKMGVPKDYPVYSLFRIYIMTTSHPPFSSLRTPAAKCLHLIRLNPITSRSELVEATGLSQPTVTRAIASLVQGGYVVERNDLTRSQGRGRPSIPLELAETRCIHAGIAVGTTSTYVALFDIKGHTLRDTDLDTPVAELSQDDFIQHIMASLNRLTAGLDRPLASVGVTTSGTVTPDGVVNAPNLGWRNVDIASQLREQFSVPITVSSAVPAIIGSEIQSTTTVAAQHIVTLFADDSIGAAVSAADGVHHIDIHRPDLTTSGLLDDINSPHVHTLIDAVTHAKSDSSARAALDRRAAALGEVAASLIRDYEPTTMVVAGSAFVDDQAGPAIFARSVRAHLPEDRQVELRMIPTHREVVRDIARAVALDYVLREPLSITQC